MTGVILRGLATRKLRAALTAIAIVLGVAMISGTYVLMDTTMHAFDNLFTTAYANAGAVVVGKSPIAGQPRQRAARCRRRWAPGSARCRRSPPCRGSSTTGGDSRCQRRRDNRPGDAAGVRSARSRGGSVQHR